MVVARLVPPAFVACSTLFFVLQTTKAEEGGGRISLGSRLRIFPFSLSVMFRHYYDNTCSIISERFKLLL